MPVKLGRELGLSSVDPYLHKLAGYVPACRKAPLRLEVSVVLANSVVGRNLRLISPPTRAVSAGAIVELVCTTETACPDRVVHDVSYLCFAKALDSGVLVVGDLIGSTHLRGMVIGFNDDHAPNHTNVVIAAARALPGRELDLEPEELIIVGARDFDGAHHPAIPPRNGK